MLEHCILGATITPPMHFSLMVILSWSILDGGVREADISENEIGLLAAELQREQTQSQIEAALRQGWMRMENQQIQVETARAEAELAQRSFELAEEARNLGVATTLEVELAQEQVYISEIALADAEIQLQAEIHELYRLAGELR